MVGKLSLLLFALLFAVVVGADKVHNNIHKYYTKHAHSDVISSLLLLKNADVEQAVLNVPFQQRGKVVFDLLTKTAAASQPPLIATLDDLNIDYRAYWVTNMIAVHTNYTTLLSLSSHSSVQNIHPNFEFTVPLEKPEPTPHIQAQAPTAIEWNVARVKAPDVWNLGIKGKGFVVAGADTGVQWTHPALKNQYRGFNVDTGVADHNYNWWDAIHATGSSCGANSKVPCDDSGHGTHTVGTMVGYAATGDRQIGVAPEAKWIACRNMNAGLGTPQTYIECLQFFVAPTDINGRNPEHQYAPHVIGNSYGCPPSEGCVADSLSAAVKAVVAAGIFFSVSAGNSGPSCRTVDAPPGTYAESFSVGAQGYQTDTIASYSSRGPVPVNGISLVKPDISAPGSSVTSAYPTDRYATLSGTSMASPHITGIIPLLWQAKPSLVRDIAGTAKLLQKTALFITDNTCAGNTTQNNVYGSGGVNVYAAVTSA